MATQARRYAPARTDDPAPAAAELARTMLTAGWVLSGVEVRIIHTAKLTSVSGLVVTISSEAGRLRVELDSEYLHLGDGVARQAWHAQTNQAMPIDVLEAVAAANASAAALHDEDTVAALLHAAGWLQRQEHEWIAPDGPGEVAFWDDHLEHIDLPWRIRRPGQAEIAASHDTPAVVIAALALTPPATV